jgi:hypothetical protein
MDLNPLLKWTKVTENINYCLPSYQWIAIGRNFRPDLDLPSWDRPILPPPPVIQRRVYSRLVDRIARSGHPIENQKTHLDCIRVPGKDEHQAEVFCTGILWFSVEPSCEVLFSGEAMIFFPVLYFRSETYVLYFRIRSETYVLQLEVEIVLVVYLG